jgi:hypothetical protein
MARPDFIISALHAVPEDADLDASHAVTLGAPFTLEQLDKEAKALASGTSVAGHVVFDVGRLYGALRARATAPGMSPATSGLLIDRVLWNLPRGPAGDVAVLFVDSLREEQLSSLGRAGLLALRDAACLAPAEESALAVRTLDDELARRGAPSCREVGGTWIIAEGASPVALEAAHERLDRMHDRPLLSSALNGLAVLVVPQAERLTNRALILAHIRAFARREFDPGLCAALSQLGERDVTALDEARVLAEAVEPSAWSRGAQVARSAFRGVVSRLRVGPEPMVASQ